MRLNIVRPTHPTLDDIEGQLSEILENGQVTNNGKYVQSLEMELQKFFNSTLRPICFCNGEMALYTLIQAWKIKICQLHNIDTFSVLVPSLTFSGTINAIKLNGLTPVFCDVDETLTIDDVGKHYTPDCRMIVGVGAYGNQPDICYLGDFAKDYNMVLVLDNAPSFGSTFCDEYPCHFGHSEIYSFHATKVFSTMEGGCAVVNDEEIHALMVQLRDFGQVDKVRGDVIHAGLNGKMTEICAIVGIENLRRFHDVLFARERVIYQYHNFFTQLEHDGFIKNMVVYPDVDCVYLYYPVILKTDATEFVEYLATHDITARRYYTACHRLGAYNSAIELPYTDEIADKLVALPLYSDMTDEEISYLFETIKNYFK